MDTQQMKYFLCLAKHLNYTSAASELMIATSTLSRQIAMLENELNAQLFSRDNKNVKLTSSGQYLQQELITLYSNYQMITQNTERIHQGFSGNLSCGILEDFTLNGIMQDNFHAYIRKHSDNKISLQRNSYRKLIDGVLDGSYDCIISFFFALDNMISLNYKIIEHAKEGILISSKNPLAKEKVFRPEKFKHQTFIVISSEENEYVASGPVEFCQQHGFTPKMIFAPDIDTATLWVEAGMGIAFSYQKSVGSYNPALTFIPLADDITMTFAPHIVLAWDKKNNNPALQQFVKEFKGINDK